MRPDYVWPDPDDRAEDLAPIADELVRRIRTDDPRRLCSELLGRLDGWQLWALVCLLAAAVDPTASPEVWWGWTRHRDVLAQAALIPLDDEPAPDRQVDTEQVNATIRRLMERDASNQLISDVTGLPVSTVKGRKVRMRQAAAGAVA
jgi:hypothetical protein